MKKRIVILSAFLSPLRSGAEACAEEVPLALCDQFDFTIVTARMRRDLPKHDQLGGKIPVIRIGIGSTIDKWLFPFLAPLVVRKIKPDVCHAILETFAGLALVFCRAPKKILTCQTTNRSFLKGLIVRSPDVVTAISRHLAHVVQQCGRDDAFLIPNGIASSALADARLKHDRIPGSILFVGRLERMKGVDVLLAAFAQLKIENCRLKIVGDGSLRRALEKQADQLNIADRVSFLGYIPPEEIAKEYVSTEVFCGLSRSEALGNVFLEAQAAGCAVVGTSVGGIPDIIEHEQTGLLVPPDDADAARQALHRLLEDRDLRRHLQEAGMQHAKEFDWERIAKRYAALY